MISRIPGSGFEPGGIPAFGFEMAPEVVDSAVERLCQRGFSAAFGGESAVGEVDPVVEIDAFRRRLPDDVAEREEFEIDPVSLRHGRFECAAGFPRISR